MSLDMLIDNAARAAEGGRSFERRNPFDGSLATKAAAASPADARAAVDSAQAAFEGWAATPPNERRALLLKAADVMEARSDDFARAMTRETGATGAWGGFNVKLAADILREAAGMVTQVDGRMIPSNKPGQTALAVPRPHGVCLGIAPWNAPVILGTRAVAMPIACGNTVVLKASEMCPETHYLIGDVFAEAGFPKGVLNVVTNAPEDAAAVVEALIAAPAVRHVNFTGSTRVGRIIARVAAEHLKPVLLELGGKAPLVVLDDADIEGAVNAAIFGCFMNQGQICMSTERVILHEAIADTFAERFAERAAALPAGDPTGKVVLGALVTPEAAERMQELIADARDKGARVLAGGTREGAVVAATVIDGVTSDMRLYREESFGPVKPLIRVRDDEEAIRIANDTEYGLSAAVFSQDERRAMRVAERIESGICHINGPTVADEPQMPFGGMKESGYGRFGGVEGMREFTITRWITIEDPQQHYPF